MVTVEPKELQLYSFSAKLGHKEYTQQFFTQSLTQMVRFLKNRCSENEFKYSGYKEQGITFPSGERQAQLLQEVYSEAGVDPNSVYYVETHGTGTKVGDPQEANAICQVFCSNRTEPLLIGSVKSNMGHAEPASGVCSLAKILLSIERQMIPPNLHYNTPNQYIPGLVDGRLKVVTEPTPLAGGIIGVNSFGFGGSNTHVILRAADHTVAPIPQHPFPKLVT